MKRIKVLKVVTTSGVYFTNKAEHKSTLPSVGHDISSYQEIEMSEEEYNAIPATEEAAKFFHGEIIGQRPQE